MKRELRSLTVVVTALGVGVGAFFLWKCNQAYEGVVFAAQEAALEAQRKPAAAAVSLVSLDEVFANVNSGQGENRSMHILGVKLDIELFDERTRPMLEGRVAG